MENLTDTIEDARRLLGEGKNRRAAGLLTLAASECHDSTKAAMIRALALQGQEKAGRFGKHRWDEAIRVTGLRMSSVDR
jgi:hypothetical protein